MASEVVINVRAEDNFSGVLGNFGSIMTGVESAIHLAGEAFRAFAGFAMEGLDAIASYERMAATFETLAAKELLMAEGAESMAEAYNLVGDKTQQLLEWSQELAINSPFTQEGVALALRTAMAYGFTTDEAQRLTEALINFAAGSGANESAMNTIALALGQIQAKGKLAGQEVLQLVNAGIAVDQILAEAFGKSTAEIVEMREKGLIPADEAIRIITEYLETNFAGAAERQANTWAGLQGTFEDLKQMGLREFFGGLFEALQPVAVSFSEWLQSEGMDRLREMGDAIGAAVEGFVTLAGIIGPVLVGDMEGLGQKIYDLGAFIYMLPNKNMWELGDAIINAGQAIMNGEPLWLAFHDVLVELAGGDGPLAGFAQFLLDIRTEFIHLKEVFETGGFAAMLGEMFGDIPWEEISAGISDFLADLDRDLAALISGVNWTEVGSEFAKLFVMLIESMFETEVDPATQSKAARAFGLAIKGIILGADAALTEAGTEAMRNLILSIGEGIANGLDTIDIRANEWFDRTFVRPIKQFLGIASPSTLFMGIGRDIVMGLIGGVDSMWGAIISKFENLFDTILNLPGINQISDFLGVGSATGGASAEFGGFGTSTGTTGSHNTGTGTGGSGQNVTNNFYGTVYIGSAGDLDTANYDCPSPNPLVGATSGQIGVHVGGR